jgi:hypothetical protein
VQIKELAVIAERHYKHQQQTKMMNFKTINPDKTISLFVKNILVFEETQTV